MRFILLIGLVAVGEGESRKAKVENGEGAKREGDGFRARGVAREKNFPCNRPMRFILLIGLVAGFAWRGQAAPEAWADPALPVPAGVAFWFDATRINAGRAAGHLAELGEGAAVDGWPDASGNRRDLAQQAAESRPTFQPAGG